ncbi:MAG: hypothetical protein HQ512_04680 [Rhodospirillales bacterium]|nr:hypothetical protein [Rhodospirillales bacterium]
MNYHNEKAKPLTDAEAAIYADFTGASAFLTAVRLGHMPPPNGQPARWSIADLDQRLAATPFTPAAA